jgi:hypothetical protein
LVGCVAGGLPAERGVRPSVSFDISRDEYFHLTGITESRYRLQGYLHHNDYTSLNNHISTARTADPDVAINRLATVALVARTLLRAYANGPSRKDRWKVTVARDRVLHRFARRVANLGRRDVDQKDFKEVRVSRRRRRKGKWERKRRKEKGQPLRPPRPDIVFACGDVGATLIPGVSGSTMPLKRLVRILKTHKYVRALVQVNEDRTSQECNRCFHAGTPMPMEEFGFGGRRQWRLKRCGRCGIFWNRDVVAALNIRSVFMYMNDHGGQRPINFVRGYRGHVLPSNLAGTGAN